MAATAGTRLLPDTAKACVNRSGAALYTDRLVGYGTPDGSEDAVDSLHTPGLTKIAGAIQVAADDDDQVTVYGPGSIVELESDGSATITYGADVEAVAGSAASDSGRVKSITATTGTKYVVGKSRSKSTVAATAGAKVLVELCHPTRVYVP